MGEKIRILFLHANNKDVGGADYCMLKLVSGLDPDRFTPVVCLSIDTEIVDLYRKEGIKTHIICMERLKKSSSPANLFKLIIKFIFTINKINTIIRKERIDIVQGNDLLDLYAPIAGRLAGKPAVQYVRWILENSSRLKKILPFIVYHLNHMVFTVSDGVADEMFPLQREKRPYRVITCYDWIDMEKVGHMDSGSDIRRELLFKPEDTLIGSVGRLEEWKGQDVFIRAAAVVLKSNPNVHFVIVGGSVEGRGRSGYIDKLKQLAKKLGIEDRVYFTGHRKDIYEIMCALDMMVHSSIRPDPLPGVVMEAMYCSCPVIGARAGGVPEEIIHQHTGLLYEPGNHEALAKSIEFLLENPETAREMGRKAKVRAVSIFDKDRLCSKIEGLYEKLYRSSMGKEA